MRWSESDLKSHRSKQLEKVPASKYRNVKKTVDGIEFDSVKESRRYQDLIVRMRLGDIKALETQKEFRIEVEGEYICSYVADFVYVDHKGEQVVEDVKSEPTRKKRDYRIKVKLMKAVHKITVVEV